MCLFIRHDRRFSTSCNRNINSSKKKKKKEKKNLSSTLPQIITLEHLYWISTWYPSMKNFLEVTYVLIENNYGIIS